MKVRVVRISIDIIGPTDRDGWEWGDAIARSLKADFNEEFGPITVECTDVEDVSRND